MAIGPDDAGCLAAGAAGTAVRGAGEPAAAGASGAADAASAPSGRMVMVRTRLGSLVFAGGAGAVSGAADCPDGRGAVTPGLVKGSATGCSSRCTTRSGADSAAMRSWNGLPCASTLAAGAGGTVLAGVVSALITGGAAAWPEPEVNAG